MCDASAELAHSDSSLPASHPPSQPLPSTVASIALKSETFSNKIQSHLSFSKQNNQLLERICSKANWSSAMSDHIAWSCIKKAPFQTISPFQKKNCIKCQHRPLATDSVQHKRRKSHNHGCSCCQQLNEDWSHLFTCPSITSKFKTTQLDDLHETLHTFRLSKPMVTALLDGINSWLTSSPPHFSLLHSSSEDSHSLATNFAFSDQSDVGWDHPLCGRLAKSWFSAHDTHVKELDLPNSAKSGTIGPKLVKTLWNFGLQFWFSRNGDICGHSNSDSRDCYEKELHDKISQAHKNQDLTTDPDDRDSPFKLPLDKILNESPEAHKNWLSLCDTCISSPTVTTTKKSKKTTTHLHQFFGPFKQCYNTQNNSAHGNCQQRTPQ